MGIVEQGYRPQVAPGPGFLPAQAGPDAFGAGVGAGLEQVGGIVHERVRAAQADQDLSSFASSFAQARAANAKAQVDLKANAAPGAAGHYEAVKQMLAPQGEQLLANIRDPEVRRHAQAQWDGYAAEQGEQAYAWQLGKQAGKARDDLDVASNLSANLVQNGQSSYVDETRHLDETVRAMTGIDEDARAGLLRLVHGRLATAWNTYLINTNPKSAIHGIDTGSFNDVLSPEELQHLRRSAETASTKADEQAKAMAAQQFGTQMGALDLQSAAYDAGSPSYDQATAQANGYQQLAASAATPEQRTSALAKEQSWRLKATGAKASEQWRGAGVDQRQAEINRLEAKEALDGDEGSTLEALKQQQQHVTGLSTIDRAAYATHGAIAPLDPMNLDPGAVASRTAYVDAARGKWGGLGEVLTKAEAAPLIEVAQRGTIVDKQALSQQLARLGPVGGRIAAQLTPTDPGFRAVLSLAPIDPHGTLTHDALAGPAALKANPQLLVPVPVKEGQPLNPTHQQLFASYTAQALKYLPEDYRAAVLYNAVNIYAARAGAAGRTNLDNREFTNAIDLALGAVAVPGGRSGGMGRSNGINVVLPYGWRQADWDQTMAQATSAKWANAAGGMIHRRDGTPVGAAELARLPAVALGNGRYTLATGPNSYLTTAKGGRFEFDARKLR